MEFLPELMRMSNGAPIRSPEDWEARRKELLNILSREIYGLSPAVLAPGQGRILNREIKCCGGHAILESIRILTETEKGAFSFPLKLFLPTRPGKHPLFLLLNFRPDAYDMYFPAEEIIDRGFALAVIYYQDITADNGDWSDKLAGCFTRPQDGTGFGKISLWAWGTSRALDYLLSRQEIDGGQTAVIGHSRLGKTALWCAAQDVRFRFAFSNDSGCGGAALEREKHPGGETAADIIGRFPYWFCENYRKYSGRPQAMPFDQHFLLAAIAPRLVAVGSASKDLWADPYAEQLCCLAASPAWRLLGKTGFSGPHSPAQTGDAFRAGEIGYHLRDGIHFLSRGDWQEYMQFMEIHR